VLDGHPVHFSISHCDHYAAVIVSEKTSCGIDIECIKPKAVRILKKFISEEEHANLFGNRNSLPSEELATLCWSIKESMFKWHGKGSVDFKKHLQILELKNEGAASCRFQKDETVMLNVYFKKMNDFFLSWVI
jgi:phosphopantetheinyl transferase